MAQKFKSLILFKALSVNISAKNWDNEANVTYFLNAWILKTSFLLVLKKGGFTLKGQTLFLGRKLGCVMLRPFFEE